MRWLIFAAASLIGSAALAQGSPAASPVPEKNPLPKLTDMQRDGIISVEHACSHGDGDHHGCETTIRLTTLKGESWKVNFQADLSASLPRLKDLNGEFVRVNLTHHPVNGQIEVSHLGILTKDQYPKQFQREFQQSTDRANILTPQLGAKPYLFILAKYSGNAAEPNPLTYYDTLMGTTAAGLQNWFTKISYGRMTTAGSTRTIWVTLPKTQAQYLNGGTLVDSAALIKDACDAVDATVDFRNYFGVNVLVNGSIGTAAAGLGGGTTMTRDGVTRTWGSTINSPGHSLSLLAHEMGHSLGLGHSGDQFGNQYGSPFDVMGSGNAVGYHAYHRWDLDWMTESKTDVVWPGTIRSIKLERRSDPADAAAKQAIRIYYGGYGSRYYVLEAIKGGSFEPAQSGVLISEVDELRPGNAQGNDPVRVVDANNNSNLADAGSLLQPGQLYTNAAHGLTISVTASGPTSYTVQVQVASTVALPDTVKTTADTGAYSLREAITFANRHPSYGVKFKIPAGQLTAGVARIQPRSGMVSLRGTGIVMDGATQTSGVGNTNVSGPEVVLDGTLAGSAIQGLIIRGPSTTINGICVQNFSANGLFFEGTASGSKVTNCYIGTDAAGAVRAKNNGDGIAVIGGADNMIIGAPGAGNLISGNELRGVGIWDPGTDNARVEANIVGLNRTGTALIVGATGHGISVIRGPSGTQIIGNTASGNGVSGIEVYGAGTKNTVVKGNRVGTSLNGLAKLGNKVHGIAISSALTDASGPLNTTIGGAAAADRNIIGGNTADNIWAGPAVTDLVTIQGNYIGLGADGATNVGGAAGGISIVDAKRAIIGGAAAGLGNTIANNVGAGIWVRSNDAVIQGNSIGFTSAGSNTAANGPGITVVNSLRARVGGDAAGAGNLLGNIQSSGITFSNVDSSFIQGNVLGMNRAGTGSSPITGEGIFITDGSAANLIGGDSAGSRNIVGSVFRGISLWKAGTTSNHVRNNWVGFAQNGQSSRAISASGILVAEGASANTIGNASSTLGNIVGNCGTAEGIVAYTATGNVIRGNTVGMTPVGSLQAPVKFGIGINNLSHSTQVINNVVLRSTSAGIYTYKSNSATIQGNILGFAPNGVTNGSIGERGILINELSANCLVGGLSSGQGNRIGNAVYGVGVFNSSGTQIYGNSIGRNANLGAANISFDGVGVYNGSTNTKVGTTGGGGNVITNAQTGVTVLGETTVGAAIRANSIFNNRGLGINLAKNDGVSGVTANDTADADTGPNGLQNFSLTTGIVLSGGVLTVNGGLASKPATTYTVDVYYSDAKDPSNYGEGQTWFSSFSIATNTVGTVTFSQIMTSIPPGKWISFTITGPEGTSEFNLAGQRP